MYCENCGTKISDKARFCSKCGESVVTHYSDDISISCASASQKFEVDPSMQAPENISPDCNSVIEVPGKFQTITPKNRSKLELKSCVIITASCCAVVFLLIASVYWAPVARSWYTNHEAVESYRKAAEQGDAKAQYNLGNCYMSGIGVVKKYELGVEWFRKAAEQGFAEAQCDLGTCYESGCGVAKDTELAVECYRKAAEKGHATAQLRLGFCFRCGTGVAKNHELAVEWFRKAAEQGDATAQFMCGVYYYDGTGVEKNTELAVEWYRKAAEQGFGYAKDRLRELGN